MANLFITIVPTKVLANGQHKIRIAVSHNWDTRYIPTSIVIDSLNEFKNGKIVKRSDKELLNAKLKRIYDTYYERCESIEYADSLTCTQLVKIITSPINGEQHRKFEDIVEEFLSQIDEDDREKRISYTSWPLNILFGLPVQVH